MSRRISVNDHSDWRHSLLTPQDVDEIDEVVAEHGPQQRRKASEVSRLEALLDELEPRGKDGEK